jgi:DNA-binding CsgD family transcriptional regulator
MAQFTRYLTGLPDPTKVASALVRGPLAVLGARSVLLMVARGDSELVLLSHHGHTDAEVRRFGTLSLAFDVPFTRCYRDHVIVNHEAVTDVEDVPTYALDAEMWRAMLSRLDVARMVCAPIVSDGASVGVLGFLLPGEATWPPVNEAFIDVITSVLGLWLSHPQNGVAAQLEHHHGDRNESLSLTPRQLAILTLISEGKSYRAIALRLGFAESTIKSDMQIVHRTLRTHSGPEAVERAHVMSLLP